MEGKVEMEPEKDLFSSQRCTCCPYGYHIDLDFLHYLDSLYSTEKLKSLKRFRRRGSPLLSPDRLLFAGNHECSRQMENMVLISDGEGMSPTEILAGIDISLLVGTTNSASITSGQDLRPKLEKILNANSASIASGQALRPKPENRLNAEPQTDSRSVTTTSGSLVSEVISVKESRICTQERIDLRDENRTPVSGVESDVLDDSQTAKKRSEVRLSLTSVSTSEPCKTTERDSSQLPLSDVLDADSGSVSPAVLQAIREQMAASLRRMKELEEQVKVIPVLQSRISMLKEENRLLFVNADRTFCDAAVGDFPLDEDFQSSSRIVVTRLESIPVTLNGEKSRLYTSANSSQIALHHSDAFPVDNQAIGLVKSRKLGATFLCNSETQTAEAGVNTEVERGIETRSVGVLCKALTKEISVGSGTTFVDAGVGGQGVSGSGQDILSQRLETEATVSDAEYSERSESVDLRRECLVFTQSEISERSCHEGLDVSEAEILSSGYSGRFRSIGIQCGDGVVPPGNDQMWKLDFPQVYTDYHLGPLKIDRCTETDRVLPSEQIAVCVDAKDSAGEEDAKRKLSDVDLKTESVSSAVTLTSNLVIVSKSEDVRNDTLEESISLEGNTSVEDQRQKLSMEVTSHSVSSTETVETGGKGAPGIEAIECFVSEQTLESPRCGISVIIDDSSESTSATASDSEDGSTMSVIEVTQRSGVGFLKTVRSVDDYFAGEENDEKLHAGSDLDGTDFDKVTAGESESLNVGSTTVSTPDVLEEKAEEDFRALDRKEKLVDSHIDVVNAEVASAANSSTLSSTKTVAEEDISGTSILAKSDHVEFTSLVETDIVVTSAGEVESVERLPEPEVKELNTAGRETAEIEVSIPSDGADAIVVSCPVTDHVELMHTAKKHPTCVVDVSGLPTESNIPAEEASHDRPTPDILKLMQEIPEGFPVASLTSCSQDVTSQNLSTLNGVETSSTTTHRRIVITETKIERRRINQLDHGEKNLLEMPLDTKSDADVDVNDDVFDDVRLPQLVAVSDFYSYRL